MKTPNFRSLILITVLATTAIAPASPPHGNPAGTALSVSARFLKGTESLLVQGTAPAGSSVLLQLTATFDRNVPVVVIDRLNIVAARDNSFTAVLPYTSASEHIAVLSVQASTDGFSPAIACCFHVAGPQTSQSPPANRHA